MSQLQAKLVAEESKVQLPVRAKLILLAQRELASLHRSHLP